VAKWFYEKRHTAASSKISLTQPHSSGALSNLKTTFKKSAFCRSRRLLEANPRRRFSGTQANKIASCRFFGLPRALRPAAHARVRQPCRRPSLPLFFRRKP
jgi:hypothetical protein